MEPLEEIIRETITDAARERDVVLADTTLEAFVRSTTEKMIYTMQSLEKDVLLRLHTTAAQAVGTRWVLVDPLAERMMYYFVAELSHKMADNTFWRCWE